MEQRLYDAAAKLPETGLDYDKIQPKPEKKTKSVSWRVIGSVATCLLLIFSVGFIVVEAKEYDNAIRFFNDYGLSTDGLSRGEIKAVYRDITTESFTYAKTGEIIANSLSADRIGGYEIWQDNHKPEDIENLWLFKNNIGGFQIPEQQGVHYKYRSEYKTDSALGVEVHDKSYLEKYEGDRLIWSVSVSEFWINGYSIVSDGVIAYGETYNWSSAQTSHAWMAKIDTNGNLLWKRALINGFDSEYITAVLENDDGSYAVVSRGDLKYFCLSWCTADGKEIGSKKTEIGNYGISNVARLGDGYIVQLFSYMTGEHARIVKVDHEGNITESFSYSSEDANYYITDMMEFNGSVYLSAYAVPKQTGEDQNAGGRREIDAVLDYLFSNGIWDISSEDLTPMVRENYTAMLLVCDPNIGTPQEFFSVKGCLGGELSLSDTGMLIWNVESIATTFYSPATSAFTIGGTSYIYRYTFNDTGALIHQEKTGEIAPYYR